MSRDIEKLSPFMKEKAVEFLAECHSQGLCDQDTEIVIICTDRGSKAQQAAYDSGASNARPGESAHNAVDEHGNQASEAFDIAVIRNGKYVKDGKDSAYQKAGVIGESLGLAWAGRWTGKIRETAHFQNPSWVKPSRMKK